METITEIVFLKNSIKELKKNKNNSRNKEKISIPIRLNELPTIKYADTYRGKNIMFTNSLIIRTVLKKIICLKDIG